MNSELGFSPEYEALRLRRDYLRGKCAEEVEEYMHLTTCVGPNLKADYMLRVGQLEYQVFRLKADMARWQRRFTLRQQALNRGETPDLVAIERSLDAEFKDYVREIEKRQTAVRAAAQHAAMGSLSDEETNAIRMNYLKAVKKLHPDLNPGLSPAAKELWLKIQAAYEGGDWRELEFLVGMVDDVLKGAGAVDAGGDALAELEKSVARLEERLRELENRRAELMAKEPLCWREFLEDADEVAARRSALKDEIGKLEERLAEYEAMWDRREVA